MMLSQFVRAALKTDSLHPVSQVHLVHPAATVSKMLLEDVVCGTVSFVCFILTGVCLTFSLTSTI